MEIMINQNLELDTIADSNVSTQISFYCQNVANSGTPNLPSIISYWDRNCNACKKFAVQTPTVVTRICHPSKSRA